MLQTSVEIVNPGGTGSPAFVISARPDPLPPSRSFIVAIAVGLPGPEKIDILRSRLLEGLAFELPFRATDFFDILDSPSVDMVRGSGFSRMCVVSAGPFLRSDLGNVAAGL